ncbi:unnamed protein product [Calypogeia fissa]
MAVFTVLLLCNDTTCGSIRPRTGGFLAQSGAHKRETDNFSGFANLYFRCLSRSVWEYQSILSRLFSVNGHSGPGRRLSS